MEITKRAQSWRVDLHKYRNKVRFEGCLYLVTGDWPELGQLNLAASWPGENEVREEGAKILAKAKWEKLTSLLLGIT